MKKGVNIPLINNIDIKDMICIVEGSIACFFEEYLTGLNIPIRYYPCKINKGEKILVIQKLLDLNYNDAEFVGLINTEQLTRHNWLMYFKDITLHCGIPIHFFDYSAANIKLMEKELGYSMYHLPYLHTDNEVHMLKHLVDITEKIYDAAFVGIANGRRGIILERLKQKGITINMINYKWGKDRDIEISKCKVLLNIHYADDYQIFEEMRCNRWLIAGMKVISETSLYQEEVSITNHPNLIITTPEKYIETVLNYCSGSGSGS